MRPAFTIFHTLTLALFCFGFELNAQDLAGIEQGIKPYGAYHGGDVDSISMVNGNLTLHIPLVSYSQRGGRLSLGFSVIYTNPVYTLSDARLTNPQHRCSVQGGYVWSLSNRSGGAGGGSALGIRLEIPAIGEVWNCNFSPCIVRNSEVAEPDGAVHQMGATTSTNWISMDTTGYTYDAAHLVLTDRQGTKYSYNTNISGYPMGLRQIEDINENVITTNFNSAGQPLTYSDTMGRLIPTQYTDSAFISIDFRLSQRQWSPPRNQRLGVEFSRP
jgi:hypothetical protein